LSHLQGRVLVHCMGGHGRTGTALAILLGLSGAMKKDPVAWLRKHYCEEAVETKKQIEYIQSLGVNTTSLASRIPIMSFDSTKFGHIPYTWSQEQYDLTKKPALAQETSIGEPVYQCILCHRKKTGFHFYQTFLDMTGFCWSCHQLTERTNPDIQSA